jgi:DNA-binding IscR family transcriptional regulator
VNAIDGYDTFTDCIMHNGSCEGVENEGKHCPLHQDYEKSRQELIELFSNRTIYDLVIKSTNTELITI